MSTSSEDPSAPAARGPLLLSLARRSLVESLGGPALSLPEVGWLREPGACFVTLTQHGALRGCIGSIDVRRALGEDVVENARSAAFHDPRFPPLSASELESTRIEVTVLSPLERLEALTEEEALSALRPGRDGVVLEWGRRRGVFIPQMWEKLPDPKVFLGYLKEKAGIPRREWPSGMRVSRFTAQAWEESEPQAEVLA